MTEVASTTASVEDNAAVLQLGSIGSDAVGQAGGKGANLGEMIGAGFPVPGGFVVSADAYLAAMDAAGVRSRLWEIEGRAARADPDELTALADEARSLILANDLPAETEASIADAYQALGGSFVAVRSSATAEDTAETSFAGMNETFTNVRGQAQLIDAVRRCWASLYGARVVAYRAEQGLDDEPAIAVVVQEMVASDRAGVMFTVDPASRDELVIEGAFGLGEVVVSGRVEPDSYRVDRASRSLRQLRVGRKSEEIISGPEGDVVRPLDDEKAWRRVLSDDEVGAIADLGMAIEAHYGAPQDIEWSYVDGELFIVQSRPITTIGDDTVGVSEEPLLHGLGVGSRRASGTVRVLESPDEGSRLSTGEILVAEMTSPDWVPIMRRAAGLITNAGGSTCHAAIVSRELGVPAVVGTRRATDVLRDGDDVTIEPASGQVFRGVADARERPLAVVSAPAGLADTSPLATKLYLNLAMADQAVEAAALPADGVGLLRGEFMVTDALSGEHPRSMIANGRGEVFVDAMAAQLETIVSVFSPRPVV